MGEIWNTITDWARDNLADWTMTKVYVGCAIAGGTVLLGQTGLNLFGLGDADADVDPDMDVDEIEGGDNLNFLSIRALAGFLVFFGLVGWYGTAEDWSGAPTALAAFGAGASVMVLVAVVMRAFKKAHSAGNLRPMSALGKPATVYLKIPANKVGKGKVTVSIQGRSRQFEAVTAGPELPTGSDCRLVAMVTEDTFEVVSLDA